MGLFGLGSKRTPRAQPAALKPTRPVDAPRAQKPDRLGMPTPGPRAGQPAEVEVSELTLNEDEFSSTFGAGASQFAETHFGDANDPWTSRLRLD